MTVPKLTGFAHGFVYFFMQLTSFSPAVPLFRGH